MIKLDKTCVMNLDNAIRGARNPMNSWAKSDSTYAQDGTFTLGENDLSLAKRLCHAGSDHRKFIRQIFISVDITAPIYWWKEYDTYKVGTVANSTSTMHKIQSKKFDISDFSADHLVPETRAFFDSVISELERLRKLFLETKDKEVWYSMIQLLPESYNQTRTCTMTYENAFSMYNARKNHKLKEWHEFCAWAETLPYFKDFFLEAPQEE